MELENNQTLIMKDYIMTNNDKVAEFMRTFGQGLPASPLFPSPEVIKLRLNLIDEEVQELKDAILSEDMVEVADAIGDSLYVMYGAALTFGIDINKIFAEIHASNMSKLDEAGKVLYREDGKILKSSLFREPNLWPILFG